MKLRTSFLLLLDCACPVLYSMCFQRIPSSSSCMQTAFSTVYGSPLLSDSVASK